MPELTSVFIGCDACMFADNECSYAYDDYDNDDDESDDDDNDDGNDEDDDDEEDASNDQTFVMKSKIR